MEGKDDRVKIVLEDGQNHPAWVWSSIGTRPTSDGPVILTEDSLKQIVWTVQPIDNGVPEAFT